MKNSLSILALVAALTGCVQTSPMVDRNFGSSLRASLAAQVADPAAAANARPVTGIDGRAAAATQKRYESSFATPTDQHSLMTGQLK
jgi:type IV pilus biogenesis protein CpaD/CtpE